MHGPIGSGLKGAHTPPSASQRTSNFAQTFQNLVSEKSTQQEQLPIPNPSQSPSVDDHAFASAHIDASLQKSIAQSSSHNPQTASPLATSNFTTNNNMSTKVAMPPTAIGGASTTSSQLNTIGHSRQWIRDTGGATTAGWNNFAAEDKLKKNEAIAQYKTKLQSASPPSALKTSAATSYEIYRDAPGGKVEVVRITVQGDGAKSTRIITQVPRSAHNAAMILESLAKYPEDHAALSDSSASAGLPSSRFFPKSQSPPSTSVQSGSSEYEAPPPAEQGLFDHDALQPAKVKFPIVAKVNLPGMKLPLPPRSPGLDKAFSASSVVPPSSSYGRAKPVLMHADDLKAKFGHLHLSGGGFANTKPAFNVDSANLHPGQKNQPRITASVASSLKPLFAMDNSSATTSKSIAEEECIDFPDFGSKPTVRIPSTPHKNHQLGYSHDSGMLAPTTSRPRYQKWTLDIQSGSDDVNDLFRDGYKLKVKLPGMENAKSVEPKRFTPRSPSHSGPSQTSSMRGARGGASRGSRGGFKDKFNSNNSSHGGNGGPSFSRRGGASGTRGGSTATSSSPSSPKPRGHWGPRTVQPPATAAGSH
jgi:hypothetical protein